MTGLLVAAPMSGSGKTTVTVGLVRALKRRGMPVAVGKAGPDYIDPAFLAAACGGTCLNFDPWAMRRETLFAHAGTAASGACLLVVEAMMGLFDAAADGKGAPADLAVLLNLPVVLVVDCARMSHSVAALVRGYQTFDPRIRVAGAILNNIAGARHEAMLRGALDAAGIDVLGMIGRDPDLVVPSRHLGLTQAGEHPDLEAFAERAAALVERGCAVERIAALAPPGAMAGLTCDYRSLPPPGQRVAVARDAAFSFCYAHLLAGWRRLGAEVSFFSPLADEAPDEGADAVCLPGGYPELHAGRLAAAGHFHRRLRAMAARNVTIYGECGGYMALGEALIDADGARHAMAGLLPLVSDFSTPRRHLGYRRIVALGSFFWEGELNAHTFHYATIAREGPADRLFRARDALGGDVGPAGLRIASVAGSFMHVIDRAYGR